MKTEPSIGHVGKLTRIVDSSQGIRLGDDARVEVFSTPSMIDLMEHAARTALAPFLSEEEDSVGIDVQVKHTAATAIGREVRGEARVTKVQKNIVDFDLEAFDENGRIGHGTHRRAVVRTERLKAKLAEKEQVQGSQIGAEMPTGLETVKLSPSGPVLRLILNRPTKKNAINRQMTEELLRVTRWLATQADSVRVVILSGAGATFSAGDDVTDLDMEDGEAAKDLSLLRGRLYTSWTRLPQVWIAEVHGVALGGGCVCAYSCDFRIASYNAQFGMPEIRLGWPPNYGVSRLISLVGASRAMELACTAKRVHARDAKEIGLVNEVVAENALTSRCESLAQSLLEMPSAALREAKQSFAPLAGSNQDERATEAFVRCLQTKDAREGVAAFLEKRQPRFHS